ncbi:Cytochrome P450 [Rhypophila sp. PSN 637]
MANTLPAALWMILHILLDEDLAARLETEISVAFRDPSSTPTLSILSSLPLLNSVYCETLRLHIAGPVGRTSSNPGFRLGGRWQIDAGVPMMSSNWLGGLSQTFWNTGYMLPSGTPEYPVETFWAERFLKYPDAVLSGPIRKPEWSMYETRGRSSQNTVEDDRSAKLVTEGLNGYRFPFGGGAFKCPGEALASCTVLTSVAILITSLRIELVAPGEAAKGYTQATEREAEVGARVLERCYDWTVQKWRRDVI